MIIKACIHDKTIVVYENDGFSNLYVTDIRNVAFCLARFIACSAKFGSFNNYFEILKKQKSVRAVVQKFNSICKALL